MSIIAPYFTSVVTDGDPREIPILDRLDLNLNKTSRVNRPCHRHVYTFVSVAEVPFHILFLFSLIFFR